MPDLDAEDSRILFLAMIHQCMDDLESSRSLADLISAYEWVLKDSGIFNELCESSGYDAEEFATRALHLLNVDCVEYDTAPAWQRRLMWLSCKRGYEYEKAHNRGRDATEEESDGS